MTHEHHGRVCHLNGCGTGQAVPVECPACEQPIGRAPKGGMAQQSATQDKLRAHLAHCLTTHTSDEYRGGQVAGVADPRAETNQPD